MIAPEGYRIVGASVAALGAAAVAALVSLPAQAGYAVAALLFGLLVFVIAFFRDPVRVPPDAARSPGSLLAPADGRVIQIEEVAHEPLYIDGPARLISIFLSPLNVHVNRAPTTGVIELTEYVPGDYLVAWHPKASEKNERSIIGLRTPGGEPVVFKQIAGAVARRIVFHLTVGDRVAAGDRYGIVKFGSRMDLLVPPTAHVTAQVGDRVRAGHSVLGFLVEHADHPGGSATETRRAARAASPQ